MITRTLIALAMILSLAARAENPPPVPRNEPEPIRNNEPTATRSIAERAKRLWEQTQKVYGDHVQPRVQSGAEAARTLYQNRVPERVKRTVECRDTYKKLGLYAGIPLAVAGAGLLYYNTQYSRGEWEDRGTEGMPSLVPKVGNEFTVEERIQSITFPRKRTLWVHNGKNGFGKIHVDGDKVQYWDGENLVAESGLIAPLGRPYSLDIPIKTTIKDGSGVKIGTVEEVSEEVDDDVHRVSYVIKDRTGLVIGKTDEFEESGDAKPKVSPWAVSMRNDETPIGDVIRKGSIKNSYHWKLSGAEEQVDPRLLIILSAYKSYVDDIRGDQ